jgi:RNA polymerase sigma-70 factor (ECF subfamily)
MIKVCTMDEGAVLAAARKGDRAAFAELVKAHQRRAYAAAYGFVGNRDDAMDLAQDAFVRAYRAMHRFDPSMPFYPWLYQIIRNTCLNHLKRKKRRGEQSLDELVEQGYDVHEEGRTPSGEAELSDLKHGLAHALQELSSDQQEIIRLRHMMDLSYGEIAETLGVPQGTVMSRLHAARKNLKRALEAQAEAANKSAAVEVL